MNVCQLSVFEPDILLSWTATQRIRYVCRVDVVFLISAGSVNVAHAQVVVSRVFHSLLGLSHAVLRFRKHSTLHAQAVTERRC